jgi:hypothetical protein
MPCPTQDGDCPYTWVVRVTIGQHFCTVGKPASHDPRLRSHAQSQYGRQRRPYRRQRTTVGRHADFRRNHDSSEWIRCFCAVTELRVGRGQALKLRKDPMKSGGGGSKTAILPKICFCPPRCVARTRREAQCRDPAVRKF